jgi:recombinational DNA repair ATPase RecF
MRAAIGLGLAAMALVSVAPRLAEAESSSAQWDAAFAHTQSLVQARAKDVRDLRKETDAFVEQLNQLVRSNVVTLKPEVKFQIAQKRVNYYAQLGAYNAAIVELERALNGRKLPKNVSPVAQQKLQDTLSRLHDEIRAMVVSLNHVARSLKDL